MAAIEPEEPIVEVNDRDLGDELELQPDRTVRKAGRLATPEDVPLRDDLPADHPLRNKRVLRKGMSGWVDSTIDANGRVVPVDPNTGDPIQPEALERR
jgi:hypothetical protein